MLGWRFENNKLIVDDYSGAIDGHTVAQFKWELDSVARRTETLRLIVDCHGGDLATAYEMTKALKTSPLVVNAFIRRAYSSASIVALAADRLTIAPSGSIIVHSCTPGPRFSNKLDVHRVDAYNATLYATRWGGRASEWLARIQKETYYSAIGALDAGLVDAIESEDETAQARWSHVLGGWLIGEK
jgi:membrane-bound ClpP family serine protease